MALPNGGHQQFSQPRHPSWAQGRRLGEHSARRLILWWYIVARSLARGSEAVSSRALKVAFTWGLSQAFCLMLARVDGGGWSWSLLHSLQTASTPGNGELCTRWWRILMMRSLQSAAAAKKVQKVQAGLLCGSPTPRSNRQSSLWPACDLSLLNYYFNVLHTTYQPLSSPVTNIYKNCRSFMHCHHWWRSVLLWIFCLCIHNTELCSMLFL